MPRAADKSSEVDLQLCMFGRNYFHLIFCLLVSQSRAYTEKKLTTAVENYTSF